MNIVELKKLRAVAVAGDKTTTGESDIRFWFATLGHLNYTDAETAVVEHFKHSSAIVTPAQIISDVRDATNDRLARENADRALRDAHEAARDAQLAERFGGAAALEARGTGNGCIAGGPEPIRGTTQSEVMDEVRTRWGLNRNVRTIKALVIDWDRPDILDQVCSVTTLGRTEAAVALHAIDCERKGVAPPEPKPRITERRTRREQSKRAKRESASRARQAADGHIRSVGEIPIFEQQNGVA